MKNGLHAAGMITDAGDWRSRDLAVLWHPCTQMREHPEVMPLVPIERGEGAWLHGFDGRRYLDAVSSWWTNIHGHAEPRIAAAIVGLRESRSLMSHNGIAGHEMRKIQEFSYDWPADVLLIVHSDGMSSRWDLSSYPGLIFRSPSVVAGVIYRDYSRGRDDALVVVVRRSS